MSGLFYADARVWRSRPAHSSTVTSCWGLSSRSGLTLTLPAASSDSPTISANRAPLLSAWRSWALKPADGPPIETLTPGRRSRSCSTSLKPNRRSASPAATSWASHGRLVGADALGLHELDDALEPERPADGRRIAAPELRDEAVVAPPRADGALRAEPVRDPLEDGARVIVEPADETRVQRDSRRRRRRAALAPARSARAIRRRDGPTTAALRR